MRQLVKSALALPNKRGGTKVFRGINGAVAQSVSRGYTYVYIYIYICMCIYIYIYTYVCVYIYIYIYIICNHYGTKVPKGHRYHGSGDLIP